MRRSPIAGFLLGVQLLAFPARAYAECPSPHVDDVLNDPRVQEALDQAWRDSMEGTEGEHEEGGWIQQCQNVNAITHEVTYFTQVLRWPHGDIDGSAPTYDPRQDSGCRTVATFHTHPGPARGEPGDDGFDNHIPSRDDYLSAASDGLPGIIRYGSGDDTTDFTYNYGTIGDVPRDPGWGCPAIRPPGSGHADPHLRTLDGLAYDFMAIGDFLLMGATAGDVEIQARLQPVLTSAAVTTGIAVRNGRDRVEWRLEGRQLIVNGATRQLARGVPVRLRSRAVLREDDEGVLFLSSAGDRLRVTFSSGSVDYSLYPARGRAGTLRGLFGNFDGDPDNDLRSADGQLASHRADEPPDYQRPLYARFGESWRVAAAASLFSSPYAAPNGVDVQTFPRLRPAAPCDARAAAEAACKAAGVSDPVVLDACVFDYTQTGGASFVASAARADRDIREGVPLAVGHEIDVERDLIGRLEGKVRDVVYPIALPAGTYLFDGRGSHSTTWRLETANGDDVLAGMNVMAANPRRVSLPEGRYRLRVAVVPESAAGRFRLRVRKPAAPEVSPLQPGARVSGRIETPGQMRVFQLQLEAGKYDFVPKSDGELWWSLTGRDGYECFDANQRVFMERAAGLQITTSGTYTLSVSGREWAGTGSYEVGFTRVP
jgi:von Willebrand factor type D domain